MTTTQSRTAADQYAARVDAVVAQRTRLRGPQPPGDLFAGLPADHPLLKSDPRRPLDANLEIIASYIEADDVIIDVGGGAGRMSLPLALRCLQVLNVDASRAMSAGFQAIAAQAGIRNARVLESDWLTVEPPVGTVALVNHVTYLTREIVPFIQKLERAGRRRVLITVNSPPPPSWNRVLPSVSTVGSHELESAFHPASRMAFRSCGGANRGRLGHAWACRVRPSLPRP